MIIEIYRDNNQQINNFASNYLKKNQRGVAIALDIGLKRIGLASCDQDRIICTPRGIINRFSNNKDLEAIDNYLKLYQASFIVVGIPLSNNLEDNENSLFIKNFVGKIDCFFENKILIFLVNEAFSSFEARKIIKNNQYINNKKARKIKKHYDDIAATVILQDFIQIIKNY
jgi:putative Holliday junction resolvase